MRERLYITTSPNTWDEQMCKTQSVKYHNVIIYSPENMAVFLNGVRYGSINEISDINNAILCNASIDEFNIIHLNQQDFVRQFNKTFKYRGNVLNSGDKIKCHINERIQIIPNTPVNIIDNQQYYWTSSDNSIVVIDGNNVIVPKKISANHSVSLVNVNDPNDIQFTIKLIIYSENAAFTADASDSPYTVDNNFSIIDVEHLNLNNSGSAIGEEINVNQYFGHALP